MQVPYLDRPLCEPVQLRPGAKLRIRRVSEASDAAANVPFPHYHDVCELVLFGRVRGSFVLAEARFRGADMVTIRYYVTVEIEDERKPALTADWITIIQFDPKDRPENV